MQRDVYYARARNYPSALEAALFPDRVPVSVYDNLIASVRRHLPAVHHYYDVRRRKMRLKDIHHYDTYVPILAERQSRHTWQQAVSTVLAALEPLGSDYCGTLERGLLGRWCDRYENRGKQSGAFSSGSYDADPYILMNYQSRVLDHVFTLAHEAGHSMHSLYSARHQPYTYYNYTIFVAEVASTFNEQLLSHHLLAHAHDDQQRAYLVNRQIDAMRGTIIRQTMFAEFEKQSHASAESGEPLTVERFQQTLPRAARPLLRAGVRPRRRAEPGVPAHSALLSGVLRLQIRHGNVGGHRPGGAGAGKRSRGPSRRSRDRRPDQSPRRLPAVPRRRLLERPVGSLARRGRRHGAARGGRRGPGEFAVLVDQLDQLL